MQYFYTFFLALSLSSTSTKVLAQDSVKENNRQYPDEFVRDYNRECVQTSITEGLEETEAQQLCGCTLDKFQSQYSLEEFKQLTAASVNYKQAEATLVEVGQVCFEEILYSQE